MSEADNLVATIKAAMKAAMKAREKQRLATIRLIQAEFNRTYCEFIQASFRTH